MNKYIKLIAIAMIAVFAAVSCAPDVSISDYDWDTLKKVKDPANNNSNLVPKPALHGFESDVAKNPRVVFNFPRQADIFKADDIEASLKTFLSFHNITQEGTGTEASTLSDPIPYKFVSIDNNNIYDQDNARVTVELDRDFGAMAPGYSQLITWIKGQFYTYSDGLKIDVDNDGVTGEAIYDDLYEQATLYNQVYKTFTRPGHRGWYFTLNSPDSSVAFTGTTATSEPITMQLARTNAPEIFASPGATVTVFEEVQKQFANSFKLQKYDGNNWVDVKTAEYETDPLSILYYHNIVVKDVRLEHGVAYRTYWSGSAFQKTTNTYYGVNQKITINDYNVVPTPQNTMRPFERTERYTPNVVAINERILHIVDKNPIVSVIQMDTLKKGAVLRFQFPVCERGPGNHNGLSELQLSSFQGENANFKIVIPLPGKSFNYLDGDYSVIGITKVEYKSSTGDPTNKLMDVIDITIDPRIDVNTLYSSGRIRLLINYGFKYTGTSPEVVFGDKDDIYLGKYGLYSAGTLFDDGHAYFDVGGPSHCPVCEELIEDCEYNGIHPTCTVCGEVIGNGCSGALSHTVCTSCGGYYGTNTTNNCTAPGNAGNHTYQTSTMSPSNSWNNVSLTTGSLGIEYSLSVKAGSKYVIITESGTASVEFFLSAASMGTSYLNDIDGSTIGYVNSSFTYPCIYNSTSAGTVYIRVDNKTPKKAAGNFRIKVVELDTAVYLKVLGDSGTAAGASTGGLPTQDFIMYTEAGKTYTFTCETASADGGNSSTYNLDATLAVLSGASYYSNDTETLSIPGGEMKNNSTDIFFTATKNDLVRFAVTPYNSSNEGTFAITVNVTE